ncbi:universal stress protein [Paraburkholderia sp. RL17-373-BIF-A]|uniref:universal stress protein n=1 Tax=Paraburkholderia sp. RL17-373-BIF-A TaxID=3031629 RepID=UPI0038BBBB70
MQHITDSAHGCAAEQPRPRSRLDSILEVDMCKRILIAIDGSETSRHAFEGALQRARENDAQVQPLYAVDNPLLACDAIGYGPSILREAGLAEGRLLAAAALIAVKRDAVAGTPVTVQVELPGQDVAERVRLAASDFKADLGVLGTHGRREFRRPVPGSVAERVVRRTCSPVLLVPNLQDRPTSTPATGQQFAAGR